MLVYVLTIESHVLREGLAERHLVTVPHQLLQTCRVSIQVACGEALVGHVHHHKVAPLMTDLGHFSPLIQLAMKTKSKYFMSEICT